MPNASALWACIQDPSEPSAAWVHAGLKGCIWNDTSLQWRNHMDVRTGRAVQILAGYPAALRCIDH
eukprot:6972128-Pyramimonas_sp.AAC.1